MSDEQPRDWLESHRLEELQACARRGEMEPVLEWLARSTERLKLMTSAQQDQVSAALRDLLRARQLGEGRDRPNSSGSTE